MTLASGQAPFGLAIDATNAYWTNSGSGSVASAPLAGGAPKTLASGQGTLAGIVAQGPNLYWADWSQGMVVGLIGGTLTTLASGRFDPDQITADATNVYWVDESTDVATVPLGGGALGTLATGSAFGIAADAANVYYTLSSHVVSRSLAGGTTTTLASTKRSGTGVLGLAVDAANVYWAGGDSGEVGQVPKGGGTPTVLASGLTYPGQVTSDGTYVFFTDLKRGIVAKVPVGGGATTTIACRQAGPWGIAVDGASVYWANEYGNAVMKAPK